MKLGKLKPVKPPSKLRVWLSHLSARLASSYVKDCHPAFMTYIEKNNVVTASVWNEARTKRMKEILKLINSDKYKNFFYKAVSYNPINREYIKPEIKWYVRIFDKIVYWLSKAYVFLFEKELYQKIKYFEKISEGIVDLSARVDKYIANSTPEQRLSRMQMIGIISRETFQEDFDILVNRVPLEVVEERHKANENKFIAPSPMRRNTPEDLTKLFRKA